MPLEITVTNSEELLERKRECLASLRATTRLPHAEFQDLKVLANAGMLSENERTVYDELQTVLLLLGEGRFGSA